MSFYQIAYQDEQVELKLEDVDVLGAQHGVLHRKEKVAAKVGEELRAKGVKTNGIKFIDLHIKHLRFSDIPDCDVHNCPVCQEVCAHCGKSLKGHHMT